MDDLEDAEVGLLEQRPRMLHAAARKPPAQRVPGLGAEPPLEVRGLMWAWPATSSSVNVVKENFTGAWDLSIKRVAPHFGFQWRDEDPGGLQSQDWLLLARETTDPEQRAELTQRILAYNEDDVRARAAIRDGMRAAHGKAAARRP